MSIPVFEVQFDRDAQLVIPSQEQALVNALTVAGPAVSHVIVLSHGWNNDMDEARTLYRDFLRFLSEVTPVFAATTVAVGILWPSKKFADADLIPGGAASADHDPAADRALLARLQEMKSLFGDDAADQKLEQMKALVTGLQTVQNQNRFVELLGEIEAGHADASQVSAEEGLVTIGEKAQNGGGATLLQSLGRVVMPKVVQGAGGAASLGGAAGIGDFFTGIKAGAMRLLNLTTFQRMKDRAGKIGRDGVNPLLARTQSKVPDRIRFHLAGHSFGGRLLTATVDGPNTLRVQTLLLMQAAFSHNGMAVNFDGHGHDGFFHGVLDQRKVKGPILITHSKKDRAVGLAYPLASRLNGDNASAIGDGNDFYGGMGANGAQHVDRADIALLATGAGAYDFVSSGKRVFNLNGDAIIQSHGDVARLETAAVLAAAMLLN